MNQDEKKQLYELWQECFGDSKQYTDFYFKWYVDHNKILTLYEENVSVSMLENNKQMNQKPEKQVLTAMLHLNPYPLMLRESEIQANYIVGVATKHEYRKQGRMRKLLIKAMKEMYQKEEQFTYLMPADEKIYKPYGFRYIYKQSRVKVQIKEERLEQIEKDLIIKKLNEESNEDRKELIRQLVSYSMDQLKRNFQIYTKRSELYYETICAEMKSGNGDVLLFYDNQKLIGYCAYMLEDNIAEVVECIIEKQYSYSIVNNINNIIYKRFACNDSSKGSDILTIHYLETFFMNLEAFTSSGDHSCISINEHPIIMARIIHLQEFLKGISARENTTIVLGVKDEILDENQGAYELHFSKHGCNVIRTKKEPELTLDISVLTSILFGYQRLEELDLPFVEHINQDMIKKWNLINHYKDLYINEIV